MSFVEIQLFIWLHKSSAFHSCFWRTKSSSYAPQTESTFSTKFSHLPLSEPTWQICKTIIMNHTMCYTASHCFDYSMYFILQAWPMQFEPLCITIQKCWFEINKAQYNPHLFFRIVSIKLCDTKMQSTVKRYFQKPKCDLIICLCSRKWRLLWSWECKYYSYNFHHFCYHLYVVNTVCGNLRPLLRHGYLDCLIYISERGFSY